MKSGVLGLLLLLWLANVMAQSPGAYILSYPVSADEVQEVLAREEFLSSHKFNSPWLRELNFRGRSNDRELSLEDYRVRFSFMNPMEIRANRQYYNMMLGQQSFERTKAINDLLLSRYELIIESYFLKQNEKIRTDFLADLVEIKDIIIHETFDVGDMIDLEIEMSKIEQLIIKEKQQRIIIDQVLETFEYNQSLWEDDHNKMISVDQVMQVIDVNIDSETIELLSKQNKIDEERSLLEIRKKKAYRDIGFIQAEYDVERGNQFNEHLGFQFGVTVPLFNTDRPDIQRKKLELIEEEVEYDLLVESEKETTDLERAQLSNLIAGYQALLPRLASLSDIYDLVQENGVELKSYQKAAEYESYLKTRQLELYADILMRYIKILHRHGKLANEPYLNYLSPVLLPFELSIE